VKIGLKFQSLGKISNILAADPPVILGQFQHWKILTFFHTITLFCWWLTFTRFYIDSFKTISLLFVCTWRWLVADVYVLLSPFVVAEEHTSRSSSCMSLGPRKPLLQQTHEKHQLKNFI